jgi:hypothetical protein
MAAKKNNRSDSGATVIQVNLLGLIVFSVALVAASGLLTYGLFGRQSKKEGESLKRVLDSTSASITQWQGETPPWGQLLTRNIELEKPDEYVAFETTTNHPPAWTFANMQPDAVRALMLNSGFTAAEADHTLLPQFTTVTPTNTVIHPDDDSILGLSPQTRASFYNQLSAWPENHYIKNPFVFTATSFETIAAEHKIDESTTSLVRKLLYKRGDAECFSDLELVLRRIATEEGRLHLVKSMSLQPATLVRLQVNPDTDIDKLLGYWAAPAAGVRFKDVRPLLESLKRVPDGGGISILYLLPQFARQRL